MQKRHPRAKTKFWIRACVRARCAQSCAVPVLACGLRQHSNQNRHHPQAITKNHLSARTTVASVSACTSVESFPANISQFRWWRSFRAAPAIEQPPLLESSGAASQYDNSHQHDDRRTITASTRRGPIVFSSPRFLLCTSHLSAFRGNNSIRLELAPETK